MIEPKIPQNEIKRLEELKKYSILDTMPEKEYDDITALASYICRTPISLISLIDDDRQWFKSRHGLDAESTPRNVAFCAHAINHKDQLMIVPDSRDDKRFHDNPLVTGAPNVVFYAGIPLVSSEGYPVGTLCVIDHEPKELDEAQQKALITLSNQVIELFEARRKTMELNIKLYELGIQNEALDNFARIAAHDIKSPLNNIIQLSALFKAMYKDAVDPKAIQVLDVISNSSSKLTGLIDGILEYSRNTKLLSTDKSEVKVYQTINELIDNSFHQFKKYTQFKLNIDESLSIFSNKTAFQQILINLISNGIKYNDHEEVIISISAKEENGFFHFNVIDNGKGIREDEIEKVFDIFQTTSNTDKSGSYGTGIGLATVKSIVEGLGGEISVRSVVGKGSNFEFNIKKQV
ncbi:MULTISPECIES: ATP-binding protein [unclassified Lentimicrobium]|uniref:sensor histidine kinase n=1 Tax=unclassified Lentimicrobium TaxID=2677434 RepID=UPI001552F020|nr:MULTISPECIES: GAF domain-containing sensor histidine kinase [unclassified Lentimicrobium]NPD45405.1 GAF domain-containing sensor histidine kinase [Lentimicrobium sp. S6]NPD84896.1 GAF domain-containing sensor histidine kinase [Lentimicrobium sp. L6]